MWTSTYSHSSDELPIEAPVLLETITVQITWKIQLSLNFKVMQILMFLNNKVNACLRAPTSYTLKKIYMHFRHKNVSVLLFTYSEIEWYNSVASRHNRPSPFFVFSRHWSLKFKWIRTVDKLLLIIDIRLKLSMLKKVLNVTYDRICKSYLFVWTLNFNISKTWKTN